MMNVSGQVVPLTLSQFMDYTFTTPRTVPESVQMIIDDITDPAECKLPTPSFEKLGSKSLSWGPVHNNCPHSVQFMVIG